MNVFSSIKIFMTNYKFTFVFLILVGCIFIPHEVNAFAQLGEYSAADPAGFFSGIWHGLLAPWSLAARWFISDVVMYAIPNTGWFYDLGFLLGVTISIPVGWLAAIISIVGHMFL